MDRRYLAFEVLVNWPSVHRAGSLVDACSMHSRVCITRGNTRTKTSRVEKEASCVKLKTSTVNYRNKMRLKRFLLRYYPPGKYVEVFDID